MEDVQIAAAAALCALSYYNYMLVKTKINYKKSQKPWKKRRWWMTTIHRNRTKQTIENMFNELICEPSGELDTFCRMSLTDFEYLLSRISPIISKKDTQLRKAIPAQVRLAITLRYLASGDSYKNLHLLFKVSSQVISLIIPEVCAAINEVLKDEMKMPSTAEEWKAIEKGFSKNFPHCVGCLDGKHIVLEGVSRSTYKKASSSVLLALIGSNYQFIFADIGSQGTISDGGVFGNSLLCQKICSNDMNLPAACPLQGSSTNVPYVFLGDGTFAPSNHVMEPYLGNHQIDSPKHEFNQRLSRSRVVVENVFGVMTAVFRVFKRPIALNPDTVSQLTITCVLLHNFLRNSESSEPRYSPPGTFDVYDENGTLVEPGSWRQVAQDSCALRPLQQIPRRPMLNAVQIRNEFTAYFCNKSI